MIKDVAARDGLQAQPKHLGVAERLQLIRALEQCAIPEIEIGSFVSPKAVPQMAGASEIAQAIPAVSSPRYSALVPNRKGYELARDEGIKTMAIAISATETMNQKNIRMSLEQTFAMASDLMTAAREDGINIHVYLAVAFECPYEGHVSIDTILQQADQLMADNPARLVIADTIGAGHPAAVKTLMSSLVASFGAEKLGCHFHDTRALAIANVYAAIEAGIRHFDSSLGGLGGCPFAPGAKGNVATEDVVLLCAQMGLHTGIDIAAMLDGIALLSSLMDAPLGGRSHYWLSKNWQKLLA